LLPIDLFALAIILWLTEFLWAGIGFQIQFWRGAYEPVKYLPNVWFILLVSVHYGFDGLVCGF